jgi:hypothetical protein
MGTAVGTELAMTANGRSQPVAKTKLEAIKCLQCGGFLPVVLAIRAAEYQAATGHHGSLV